MLICCLLLVPAWASAGTLPVPSPSYPTIQSAIAAAVNGDTVLVSPGTYVENIDFLGKRIVVESASGPTVTVIDGGGGVSVVTFQSGENNDSRLEGFTLTNGAAYHWAGGGGVDLGADECHPHLYFMGQFTPGGSGNLRLVGAAGTVPVLLWMGAGLRDVPIQTGYGPWYLEDPIFFTLYLGSLPSPGGLLDIPFTLPPTTPAPLSLYLQAGMGTAFVNAYELRIE